MFFFRDLLTYLCSILQGLFLSTINFKRQMNIYVGNLSFRASEQDVQNLFAQYGEVSSARIIKDKFTGRSRGFAIVEMNDDSSANAAIAALHEKEFMERNLVVNEARPRENSGNGGGGNFNRGGGGNGGNNRRY